MNTISSTNSQSPIVKSRFKKSKLKLGLKKNFSSVTSTTISNKANTINNNKRTISLFIENSPSHYKLPLDKNSKNTFEIFSDRKYKRKKLMDSIETFFQQKNSDYYDYNNGVSDLMTKYIYSNPDADTTIKTQYEITKSKINFYQKNKKIVENYLTKSKSNNKYNLHNLKIYPKLGYDEEKNTTKIKLKDIKYQSPIDSLGLLLRNKIVHDKILLNYQDREVHNFGKTINIFNDLNKFEKFNRNIKVTPIIPTVLDNDIFSYKKYVNEDEENKNNKLNFNKKLLDRMIYLELNDFIKGSVYLLCDYFRPRIKFPESREEFCMNYEPVSNSIYIFSGNSCNLITNQIWKFNNNNLSWTNLKSKNYITEPRRGHSGIIYKNKYYIFGGKLLHTGLFAKLDIYNFESNTWSVGDNSTLFFKLRRNHISCLVGSQMFIHGGVDENDQFLDDSYLLNLNGNINWSKASIMPILIPPKLAYHSCCLVVTSEISNSGKFTIYKIPNTLSSEKLNVRIKENGLYIFGGKNKKISNDMWLLKIGKKPLEWIKLFTFGKQPCPRYLCSMNFFEKGNFIVIHGGKTMINDEKFALNDTYLFELYRYQWIKVDYGEKEKIVRPRCSHCSVIFRNKLYIFGGINEKSFNGSNFFIINLDVNSAKESLIIKENKNNSNKDISKEVNNYNIIHEEDKKENQKNFKSQKTIRKLFSSFKSIAK